MTTVVDMARFKAQRRDARFAAGLKELKLMDVAQSVLNRIIRDKEANTLASADHYLELIDQQGNKS